MTWRELEILREFWRSFRFHLHTDSVSWRCRRKERSWAELVTHKRWVKQEQRVISHRIAPICAKISTGIRAKRNFDAPKEKKKVFFKEILWLWKFQAITKTKTPAACGQLEVFLVEEPSGGSALKFSQFASASSIFSPIWEGFPRMQKHGCCWRWAARAVAEPVSKSK